MKMNFDFNEYEKYCVENGLDKSDFENVDKFKAETKKVAESEKEQGKIAEQEQIFDLICKHFGLKVKYDKKFYKEIDKVLLSIVFATDCCNILKELRNDSKDELNDDLDYELRA